MRISRFILFAVIFLLFQNPAAAQDSPTAPTPEPDEARAELEKNALKLVDQTIGEIDSLKLWENRALAFAIAGDLLWPSDQKRARQLFRNSADELVRGAFQPKDKPKDYYEEYAYWQDLSPRRVILLSIAGHDADLALSLLKETRPPELQAAIDMQNRPTTGQTTPVELRQNEMNNFKVREELDLEQSFAVKAAEQDPKKAAKLIRESLARGVSMAAISLVQKVNKKDAELGRELLGEIITKLLDASFREAFDVELQVAQFLLDQSARPEIYKNRSDFEQLIIEPRDLRAIANKLADYYLQATSYQIFFGFSRVMRLFEKYTPEKVPLLKQKERELGRTMSESMRAMQETFKLLEDPNASAEQLMAEAKNQTDWQKFEFYRRAIDKFIEAGEGDKARQLLRNEASSLQLDNAINYLNSKLSENAIKADRFEEARELINRAETPSAKIKMLVDLAVGFEKKNTEEGHKNALLLIKEAAALVNQFPESSEEAADILKVVSGLAIIDPPAAFPYLNNLIYMANDLLTAYALIAKYNKRSGMFKDGEMVFTRNLGRSFTVYGRELGALAKADFAKTAGLLDEFQRPDVRTLAKLLLARSILKEDIRLEGNTYFYEGD